MIPQLEFYIIGAVKYYAVYSSTQKEIQLTLLISALIKDTLTTVLIIYSHQAIVATLVMNFMFQVMLLKNI
jgi:hypothetical protein